MTAKAELGSVPGLREAMEARDVYIVGTDDDVLFGLVEAVEAAERFFFGRAAEDELALAAALRRFDFGDGK